MSGIASIMLRKGVCVSGSDLKENKIIAELKKLGAAISIGHDAANIQGADMVVYSSAIKGDNPEIIAAQAKGISLIKRAEALALLMKDKEVITVTGSHGKTTTSSLVSLLLSEAGFSPTAAIGGILMNTGANSYNGTGKYFVAEADESDGSFLFYNPKFSIITNIDYEHLDYYKTFENELEAFRKYIQKTEEKGRVFYSNDDLNLKKILGSEKKNSFSFGLTKDAEIYPKNIRIDGLSSQFDCCYKGKFLERFGLSLAGLHNISNSLAVIALGLELGVNIKIIKKTLESYKGAGRRIEIKYRNDRFLIIDDYAHHPTEIKATLKAIKNIKPGRIVAVFQPHRYSRTRLLLDDFGRCFELADYIIITDIYPASEPAIAGLSGRSISDKIKQFSPAKPVDFIHKEDLLPHLLNNLKPDDLIITLGAGDIVKVCDELVEELKR